MCLSVIFSKPEIASLNPLFPQLLWAMLSTVTSTCAAFNKVDRENLKYSNNTVKDVCMHTGLREFGPGLIKNAKLLYVIDIASEYFKNYILLDGM